MNEINIPLLRKTMDWNRTVMIKRMAILIVAIMVSVLLSPASPASAAGYTYIEDHTGSAWPVYSAQNYVDQYTGSDWVYGACRSGARCVRVYEKTISSSYAAYTCPAGWNCLGATTWYTRIYVNPQRNGYSYGYRIRVITHELGHAGGITWHSPGCNIMYAYVYCGGTLTGYYFTSTQKSYLARS